MSSLQARVEKLEKTVERLIGLMSVLEPRPSKLIGREVKVVGFIRQNQADETPNCGCSGNIIAVDGCRITVAFGGGEVECYALGQLQIVTHLG